MGRKKIRMLAFMLAAVFGIVWIAPLAGRAAPVVDLSRNGSLTVYATGADGEFAEDLAKAGVVIDLYRVGAAVELSGQDGYGYRPDPFYEDLFRSYGEGTKDGLLDDSGKVSPEKLDAEVWRRLAWRAAEAALGVLPGEVLEDDGTKEEPAEVTPGEAANTLVRKGAEAGSRIENLEPGLYLLIARGADLAGVRSYVGTAETKEGESHLVTTAYSEDNGYIFEPVLVSIPEPDEDGAVDSAGQDAWIYDISVYLKPEQMPYGSLYIIKDLLTYESSQEASFVFQVDVTLGGRLIDSRVVGMTFTSAGRQELLLDKIPAGSVVTVTEVYSGAAYTQVGAGPEPVTIRATETASVQITNDYDEQKTGGHSIINQFSYEYGEDGVGGWTVDQIFSGQESPVQ